mmetsp:Transcript_15119/g.38349  ORF Transcript_15119/g.38349 Transcript_15119/m.38349 type:complete len:548 (+) Transcript_15119:1252-2895(+)
MLQRMKDEKTAKNQSRSRPSSSLGSSGGGGGGTDPGAAALQAKAEMMLRKMQSGDSSGSGGGGTPSLTITPSESAAMAKLGKGTIDRKQAQIIQQKLREERERKQKQLESANKPSTQDMLKQIQQRKAESEARMQQTSAPASSKLQESSQLMAKLKEDRQAGVRSELPSTLVSKLSAEERAARRRSRRSSTNKIRSLADLQNAIKRADDRKKTAKREVLQSTIARKKDAARRQANLAEREKRRLMRQQRELKMKQKRAVVDKQLSAFATLLQGLEGEFAKIEKERIEKERVLQQERAARKRLEQHVFELTALLKGSSSQMDNMKERLDGLVKDFPPKLAKGSPFYNDMTNFQEDFWKLRHKMYVDVAKQDKATSSLLAGVSLGKLSTVTATTGVAHSHSDPCIVNTPAASGGSGSASPAPPPPPPPPGAPPPPPGLAPRVQLGGSRSTNALSASAPSKSPSSAGAGRGDLLSSIRAGTSLRKVDAEELSRTRAPRQSMSLLSSLQDTLRMALDSRRDEMLEDDYSDEDDWSDEWSDDDDDFLDEEEE